MQQGKNDQLVGKTGFQQEKRVKYLGIQLTNRTSTIMEDNYLKLLREIQKDLEKWEKLQLSMMGRITTIKMNVLPILILFQAVPIILKNYFFQELSKVIVKFVWQGKKPRIKMKILQDFKHKGGFGLPDWSIYYKACSLVWIKEWMLLENQRLLTLEGHNLKLGWHAILWYRKTKGHNYVTNHILRKALLQSWDSLYFQIYQKIPRWVSPIEAFTQPALRTVNMLVSYDSLLKEDGTLKVNDDLGRWWVPHH